MRVTECKWDVEPVPKCIIHIHTCRKENDSRVLAFRSGVQIKKNTIVNANVKNQ